MGGVVELGNLFLIVVLLFLIVVLFLFLFKLDHLVIREDLLLGTCFTTAHGACAALQKPAAHTAEVKLMRAAESDLAGRCYNLVTADGALHFV
jgi:hypothetical protein